MSIFSRIRLKNILYLLVGLAVLWGAFVVVVWSWRAHGQPYTSGIVTEVTPYHIVIERNDGTREGILYDEHTTIYHGPETVHTFVVPREHIVAAGRYERDGHFHARVIRIIGPRIQ